MTEYVTGLSKGDFHLLNIFRAGSMQNINTVLDGISSGGGGGGSGGITDVTSGGGVVGVTTSGTTRVVSVNLNAYSNTAQMNSAISSTVANFVTTAALTSTLASYPTVAAMNTAIALPRSSITFKYGSNSNVLLSVSNANKMLWDGDQVFNAAEVLTACANAVTITGPFGTPTTNTAGGQRSFTYDPNY